MCQLLKLLSLSNLLCPATGNFIIHLLQALIVASVILKFKCYLHGGWMSKKLLLNLYGKQTLKIKSKFV
jgi:hypothetical protein